MTESPAAKVLVVDDEPNIRDLLSEALSLNGFAVKTASSGRAALEAVARERPDIIVLDVRHAGRADCAGSTPSWRRSCGAATGYATPWSRTPRSTWRTPSPARLGRVMDHEIPGNVRRS
ncbi:response regulator [Nonomuraea sp. H19]|uniref:response regulator n=1 Tax=Nonomuraea sp. H19 TaxID=3452206 RepID=UPI003F8B14FC